MSIPDRVNIPRGYVLCRWESAGGQLAWKLVRPEALREGHHATLCRAFGLAEITTTFDFPKSLQQVESGGLGPGRRVIEGFVFQGPKGEPPIGKITVCFEGEKFSESHVHDPLDRLR